jgi:hypothetical protein
LKARRVPWNDGLRPFELHNLAADPGSASALADMVARMKADHSAIPSS